MLRWKNRPVKLRYWCTKEKYGLTALAWMRQDRVGIIVGQAFWKRMFSPSPEYGADSYVPCSTKTVFREVFATIS